MDMGFIVVLLVFSLLGNLVTILSLADRNAYDRGYKTGFNKAIKIDNYYDGDDSRKL
tara:strand:+ start:1811 stop:1981 length:171 start_codon:yes stop_codon:yes gene_type:complete